MSNLRAQAAQPSLFAELMILAPAWRTREERAKAFEDEWRRKPDHVEAEYKRLEDARDRVDKHPIHHLFRLTSKHTGFHVSDIAEAVRRLYRYQGRSPVERLGPETDPDSPDLQWVWEPLNRCDTNGTTEAILAEFAKFRPLEQTAANPNVEAIPKCSDIGPEPVTNSESENEECEGDEASADPPPLPDRFTAQQEHAQVSDTESIAPLLKAADGEEQKPDGPEEGCRVRWKQQTVEVRGKRYKFIDFMWNRNSASFKDIQNALGTVGDSTMYTWTHRANLDLAGLTLPWKLTADVPNRVVRKEPR